MRFQDLTGDRDPFVRIFGGFGLCQQGVRVGRIDRQQAFHKLITQPLQLGSVLRIRCGVHTDEDAICGVQQLERFAGSREPVIDRRLEQFRCALDIGPVGTLAVRTGRSKIRLRILTAKLLLLDMHVIDGSDVAVHLGRPLLRKPAGASHRVGRRFQDAV